METKKRIDSPAPAGGAGATAAPAKPVAPSPSVEPTPRADGPRGGRGGKPISLFDAAILKRAAWDSVRKLSPMQVARNPVMFVVEVGSVLTTILVIRDLFAHGPNM